MAGVKSRAPVADLGLSTRPEPVPALPWQGSPERLLELAQSGAPAAVRLVYDRFADDIHRVVYRVLGPDAEHEDVVQQVFLQILRDVSRLRDASKLQGWVKAVAVNTARALIRKRKLRFWLNANADEAEAWSHEDDGDGRELVRRTYAVLRLLRTEDRVAFSLRYIEGYQVQEVASLTGASLATVHRRLARGEAEFRRLAGHDELLRERLASAEAAGEEST
jgi:RNA polymerase sigma-70 factor, ECF subfamily